MTLADRRVLVTGGRGFLGRHLLEELDRQSVGDVVVPTHSHYDLTEQEAVRQLFQDTNPDIVIHLAAEVGGIGANQANPGRYFYANAAMGINMIETSREHGLKKFVQVGTVCSYPKRTPVPFSEENLWEGYPEETNAPYGIAKKALLVMLQAYRQQYGLAGIFLLPANLYGPGDNFDPHSSHVIPALVRKFAEAVKSGLEEVVLWGTGRPSREFLYVKDAARAIYLATEGYDEAEPVNIGTGSEVTIRDLAAMIATLAGFVGRVRWDESRPDGQPRRTLDTSRAQERFGFQAEVDLEIGLRETVDWWLVHGTG